MRSQTPRETATGQRGAESVDVPCRRLVVLLWAQVDPVGFLAQTNAVSRSLTFFT